MLDPIERERRKREFFFEITEIKAAPEVASPQEVLEAGEDVEDLFGVIGALVGGAVGGILTGGTGFALLGAIAQGIATGFAIGSMIDSLFAPEPDTPEDPQRLPDPTYSINSAGSEALAARGGVIPLVYTAKKINPRGGVRYLGRLIYSSMTNRNNRGVLRQLYVLGYQGIEGNQQKTLRETLLFNQREADEIFFEKVDDEVSLRFLPSNQLGTEGYEPLSAPFSEEFSQALNPSQFQKFGYKLVTETDPKEGDGEDAVYTDTLIHLPDDDDEDEINENNVFVLTKSFSYIMVSDQIRQFQISSIDTQNFTITSPQAVKHRPGEKILENHKFKYSTSKVCNAVFFNIDYTIFAKDLKPTEDD